MRQRFYSEAVQQRANQRWVLFACLLATLIALGMIVQAANGQQPASLGEAARQARLQKKQAAQAKRVWTNDNLRTSGASIESGAAQPAPGGEEGGAGVASGEAGAAEPSPEQEKERAEVEKDLAAAKELLARLQQEIELLKRDYNLRREQHYSNPGYASDTAGKAALDTLQRQIQAKGEEVQQAQQKITGLTEKLEALNRELGPKKEKPLTPDEQRASWGAKLRPLREELARVEAELARLRTLMTPPAPGAGGNPTTDMFLQFEKRRGELQRQIAALEEEARRAGVPPAWVR